MKLQIGFTGRYQGRGFWRRVFGSGPVRMTPVDVAVREEDQAKVAAAAETLAVFFAAQPPSEHRLGSLFDLVDVRPFINVKATN